MGVFFLKMTYFDFFRICCINLSSSFILTDLPINFNIILGILILITVLILILITLILNSIIKLKNLSGKFKSADEEDSLYDEFLPPSHNNITYKKALILINDDLETFGFAYDEKADFFYSIIEPWQKDFGYCSLYDEAGPALSMIFDSEPIYFDYQGKHWLIEFWKGQYGITTGGEVGVYNTDNDGLIIPGLFNGRFYQAVDESDYLDMAFSLYKKNKLLIKQRGTHWWLTGFLLGEFSHPHELKMNIEISFNDKDMLLAFVGGLTDAGYSKSDFSVKNNTAYIFFDVPHTEQPFTRTNLITDLMQENNSRNVKLFNSSTNALTNIVDKLYYLRIRKPDYYKKALEIGKPTQLYSVFNTIKKHLD